MAYLIVLFGIGIWAAWPLESSTAGFIGIVFAALVFWFWLCARFPVVAIFFFGFLRGLLGGRRW